MSNMSREQAEKWLDLVASAYHVWRMSEHYADDGEQPSKRLYDHHKEEAIAADNTWCVVETASFFQANVGDKIKGKWLTMDIILINNDSEVGRLVK